MLSKVKEAYFGLINQIAEQHHTLDSRIGTTEDELKYRIGISAIAAARCRYDNIQRIEEADLRVFSQYGEDGILDFITSRLGLLKPTFIEIGTEDYRESNTRFLYQRTNTKGLIIDSDTGLVVKVKAVLLDYYWKGDLLAISDFVTKENIVGLLKASDSSWYDTDIFSLDIDGNDYWIMREIIELCSFKVIVAEYNSYFGADLAISTPYRKDFNRTGYHFSNLCFGASLKAFVSLMAKNGYIFAGSNLNNSNGFWIREDLFSSLGITAPSTANLAIYTTNHCRESRNIDRELSYLSGAERLRQIESCIVAETNNDDRLIAIDEIVSRLH